MYSSDLMISNLAFAVVLESVSSSSLVLLGFFYMLSTPLAFIIFWLGDYPTTALSIAGQAGIITNIAGVHRVANLEPENEKAIKPNNSDEDIHGLKSIIITGPELMTLTPAQVEQLCQYEEIVFARTTPEQKLRIVREFMSRGNVVAVIGDGVNDAPSLKAASCGVAMSDGSDVAKEAADLVLLGEFSSIIVAIEYGKVFRTITNTTTNLSLSLGRLVYDNLKKTCLYLLPAGRSVLCL